MAFLDDLNRKLSEASQNAAIKSKNNSEIGRLKAQIAEGEKSIADNYCKIGKLYVAMHSADCEEEFKNMIRLIAESQAIIADYQKQIETIMGITRCVKCNAEIPLTSAFCSFCGTPAPQQTVTNPDNMISCSSCGKMVEKGMRFCTACGKPMVQTVQPVMPTAPAVSVVQPAASVAPVEQVVEPVVVSEPVVAEPIPSAPVEPPVAFEVVPAEPVAEAAVTVSQPAAAEPAVEETAKPAFRFCTECGTKLDGDALFCTECGTKCN